MRILLPFSLLLAGLLLAGCQSPPAQQAKTAAKASAAPRTTPAAPLRNTRWVLRELAGQPLQLPTGARAPYLLLRPDGTAEGDGGCNRFRGSYFSKTADALKFSPLMSTRMACPALNTENDFTRVLGASSRYRISGDTLRVLDERQAVVARLEAVYLK